MNPSNFRIITLQQAIEEFGLEDIFGADFEELITDCIDEADEVTVFDGDTEFTDINLNQVQGIVFGEPYAYSNHGLIIVSGNLSARNIYMWQVKGLVVLGSLRCKKICLKERYPLYVKGALTATEAVLAHAEKEWTGSAVIEEFGPMYARIQGSVSSPQVQTWFMPLQHLNWTEDSGKELAEDKEYHRDKWVSDSVWAFRD